jgi:hypothetical protein
MKKLIIILIAILVTLLFNSCFRNSPKEICESGCIGATLDEAFGDIEPTTKDCLAGKCYYWYLDYAFEVTTDSATGKILWTSKNRSRYWREKKDKGE